jgi:hypothetical protein
MVPPALFPCRAFSRREMGEIVVLERERTNGHTGVETRIAGRSREDMTGRRSVNGRSVKRVAAGRAGNVRGTAEMRTALRHRRRGCEQNRAGEQRSDKNELSIFVHGFSS